MELNEVYNEVKNRIERVDFDSLWSGFFPLKFALYDENKCYFDGKYIEKTNEFLANTSILFNGEYIAIWFYDGKIDLDILASKMIHEMFHGYQMINNESRFPDEMDALKNYTYSNEHLSAKLYENELITRMETHFDTKRYKEFLAIRKFRKEYYPYEFLYEAKIEQIEGTANYIELSSLKIINKKKYKEYRDSMLKAIRNPNSLLPIRIISYSIGALLLDIIASNNLNLNTEFSDTTFSEELIKNVNESSEFKDYDLNPIIRDYFYNARCTINDAICNWKVIEEKPYDLLGVNIYDAIYVDNYFISSYFVMYGDKETPIIKNGDFVIEISSENKIVKLYQK